jgi:hypothetical protein
VVETPGDPLVADLGRRRHDVVSIQDLVAPAVIREAEVVLVRELATRRIDDHGHGILAVADGPP